MLAAVGMTLMAITNTEMRRRRTSDKLRLSLYTWLFDNEKDTNTGTKRLRLPTKILGLEGRVISTVNEDEADGVCREIVNPSTALTPNLNVVVLTIPPKQELIERKSAGVEFYYVIQGDGKLYRTGEALDVGKGDGFVVDPQIERSISNRGYTPLTLLRVADCAGSIDQEYDMTQLDPKQQSVAMNLLSSGLTKVGGMVKDYSTKTSGDTQ
jgi:mannose-6-phosphate isomerase-like protein (cupin superfamily)